MTNSAGTAQAGWYDDGSGRQRWWDGAQWTNHFAPPIAPHTVDTARVPGRVAGFVLGLVALVFFVTVPIVCLPLAIPGWVLSVKALRLQPAGTPGRGLSTAGLVISIIAVTVTTLLMLLAIPGAWRHNFG